jgi:hypothetical protein
MPECCIARILLQHLPDCREHGTQTSLQALLLVSLLFQIRRMLQKSNTNVRVKVGLTGPTWLPRARDPRWELLWTCHAHTHTHARTHAHKHTHTHTVTHTHRHRHTHTECFLNQCGPANATEATAAASWDCPCANAQHWRAYACNLRRGKLSCQL